MKVSGKALGQSEEEFRATRMQGVTAEHLPDVATNAVSLSKSEERPEAEGWVGSVRTTAIAPRADSRSGAQTGMASI